MWAIAAFRRFPFWRLHAKAKWAECYFALAFHLSILPEKPVPTFRDHALTFRVLLAPRFVPEAKIGRKDLVQRAGAKSWCKDPTQRLQPIDRYEGLLR
jgi:hypothetical protein